MTKPQILLVDDEEGVRFAVGSFLATNGYDVLEAGSCREAEAALQRSIPDAVLLDYRLPDGNAFDLLRRIKEAGLRVPVVILTAHGSIELAVQAMREGAEQFLTKPVELPAILVILRCALENRRIHRKQLAETGRQLDCLVDPFAGTSAAIRQVADQAERLSSSEAPILLLGDTGTGKGVIASWLHRHSPRADEAFVDVNCASLSDELFENKLFGHTRGAFTGADTDKGGLLEVAHHGSLFLDEVGDMPLSIQGKLLKVLEEKHYRKLGAAQRQSADIRLIVATNQDLITLMNEGQFRKDLYFRLNTLPLRVPSLRERKEDIPILVGILLGQIAAELGCSPAVLSTDAEAALVAYDWPGNIRELRNILERAELLRDGPTLTANDLQFPSGLHPQHKPLDTSLSLAEMERRYILEVLQEEGGHVGGASKRLEIPRSSLYQKIKKLGITRSKNPDAG